MPGSTAVALVTVSSVYQQTPPRGPTHPSWTTTIMHNDLIDRSWTVDFGHTPSHLPSHPGEPEL